MNRIRAYHPPSGSVLVGEVTRETGAAPMRSFELIPDGLLESVVLREGVWYVWKLAEA